MTIPPLCGIISLRSPSGHIVPRHLAVVSEVGIEALTLLGEGFFFCRFAAVSAAQLPPPFRISPLGPATPPPAAPADFSPVDFPKIVNSIFAQIFLAPIIGKRGHARGHDLFPSECQTGPNLARYPPPNATKPLSFCCVGNLKRYSRQAMPPTFRGSPHPSSGSQQNNGFVSFGSCDLLSRPGTFTIHYRFRFVNSNFAATGGGPPPFVLAFQLFICHGINQSYPITAMVKGPPNSVNIPIFLH